MIEPVSPDRRTPEGVGTLELELEEVVDSGLIVGLGLGVSLAEGGGVV